MHASQFVRSFGADPAQPWWQGVVGNLASTGITLGNAFALQQLGLAQNQPGATAGSGSQQAPVVNVTVPAGQAAASLVPKDNTQTMLLFGAIALGLILLMKKR